MQKFDTPLNFGLNHLIDGKVVMYLRLKEIRQGFPEVGLLSIDGEIVSSSYFGGPLLFHLDSIFLPIYSETFFRKGFQLAKVNLKTSELKIYGKIRDLIYLDKIEGNNVYFFEDLDKLTQKIQKI